jgi:ubiquinol oxidase
MKQATKVKMIKILQHMPKPKWVMHSQSHRTTHPVFDLDQIESLHQVRRTPAGYRDYLASGICNIFRKGFDTVSNYKEQGMDANRWLTRVIILERDNGWINHLLAEAENERMHLFIFMKFKDPGFFFRWFIVLTQGVMFNALF